MNEMVYAIPCAISLLFNGAFAMGFVGTLLPRLGDSNSYGTGFLLFGLLLTVAGATASGLSWWRRSWLVVVVGLVTLPSSVVLYLMWVFANWGY